MGIAPSCDAFFAEQVAQVGQPYNQDNGRTVTGHIGTDCSGSIGRSFRASTGGEEPGGWVTTSQWAWVKQYGQVISFDEAYWIVGSGLICPNDPALGWGNDGHTGLSDGNGGTCEATPPMVQRLPITYQPWSSFGLLYPGIDYTRFGYEFKPWGDLYARHLPPEVIKPKPIYRENTMLAEVQRAEDGAIYLVGDVNKHYIGFPDDVGAMEAAYAASGTPLPKFTWTGETLAKWPTLGRDFGAAK